MNNEAQMKDILSKDYNSAKTDFTTQWIIQDKSKKKNITKVYVEGNTDICVYEHILDKGKCNIYVAPQSEGKSYIQNLVAFLSDQKEKAKRNNCEYHKFEGVIAIVDEDLDGLQGIKTNNEYPIFSTGDHDIECLLLHSQALNTYIQRIIPFDSMNPSKKEKAREVYRKIENDFKNLGKTMGFMRWTLQKGPIKGKIKGWDKTNFIIFDQNKNTFSIDEEQMVRYVVDYCKDIRPVYQAKLLDQYKELKKKNQDVSVWKVAQGHDLINILINVLLIYLHEFDSNRNYHLNRMKVRIEKNVSIPHNGWIDDQLIKSEVEVVEDLASYYESGYFQKTSLYKNLFAWENQENNKYRVLKKQVPDDVVK